MTKKKDPTVIKSVRVRKSKAEAVSKKHGNWNKAVNTLIDNDLKEDK